MTPYRQFPQTDIILSTPGLTGQKGESILRLIKTLADLRNLRASATLPPTFLDFLDHEFLEASREAIFPDEVPTEEFNLDGYGHLVLLEQGDTAADWAREGLVVDQRTVSPEPEFAERLNIEDFEFYRIAVMFNNDNIVRYYSPVGIHPPGIEEYLAVLAGPLSGREEM